MRPYATPVAPLEGEGAAALLALLERHGELALRDRMLSRAATAAAQPAPLEVCEVYQAAADAVDWSRRRRGWIS